MGESLRERAGKVAYGVTFCVVLPLALWLWARGMGPLAGLPAVHSTAWGAVLIGAGALLMIAGMVALRVRGGGLPMNAFPPVRRVETGVYAWVDHPIYLGFCATVAGAAVWSGSALGLWVVTPAAILGCAALVLGFEQDDLERRLGPRRIRPRLRIATPTEDPPDTWDLVSTCVLVFAPWLVGYELIGHITAEGALNTRCALDAHVTVLGWTEIPYAGAYALAVVPPLLLRTRRDLRRFQMAALWGMGAGFWLSIVMPGVFEPRAFPEGSVFSALHALERADGVGGRMAFPSFHAFWAVLGAWALGRVAAAAGVGTRLAAWGLGALVAASCVTTGMHGVVDVSAGVGLGAAALAHRRVWTLALRAAQRVADAWREWRIGPARVLVHAPYAGLAAGVGVMLAGCLGGPGVLAPLLVMSAAGLVGAGAWGQAFEGSTRLARPFGYYGCVLGVLAGAAASAALGWPVWRSVGALAVAVPWVQAIGRLRCLVQGCCHGRPREDAEPGAAGLRYTTAASRVCALAGLHGVLIHPTQLYSIIANIAIGGLLVRMHFGGASPPMVAGAYGLTAGLARFVEEHFRGEPQTRTFAGLRAYQWLACAAVFAGGAVMCVRGVPGTPAWFELSGATLAAALACAAAYGVAMGVDFPGSARRFARLA